ncbi:ABC transporter permease [Paenibacillus sp. KS-LC4]|uniref:ABC transporter permease n=1 Tax=Paenibacillus sp. KS-LC4 TaxID=2979727 RepID=UPI0030D1C29C
MPSLPIAMQLIRRTMGTRRGFFLNVLLPAIALSVIAGLFSSLQFGKEVIIISNADRGAMGAYVLDTVNQDSLYEVKIQPDWADKQVREAVAAGDADAAIFIPADFTERLLAGEQPQPVLYRWTEQLWNASLLSSLEAQASSLAAAAELLQAAGGGGVLDAGKLSELLEQQQARPAVALEHTPMKLGVVAANPIMIGVILLFLMLLVSQSVGFIMEDREIRTMARMYTAPLRALDIALGNYLGSILVGTIQLVLVLSLTYYVFGYSPGVSFGAMLLVLEAFMLAAIGVMTAVAGLVRNAHQLSQINLLIVTPTSMISGCFFPLSMMPEFMQKLANFMPQKWALQAIDKLSTGAGLSEIAQPMLILMLFAVVLLIFGGAVLRPSQR